MSVEYNVQHFINGEFVDGGQRFPVIYPATGEQIGTAPEGKQAEIDAAVTAARAAFKTWGPMKPSERQRILHRFADEIQANGEELARLQTLDVGRPLRDNGPHYIARAAANIRFFADYAAMAPTEAYPMENGYINYVLRHPLGVAGLITPWNVPLMLETWKLGPALAFGNTVVLKPAEWTPLGAWKLAELAQKAGLPPGVFNVVHGMGPESAGEYLTTHPEVNLISFTGETTTGKAIMRNAAASLKRLSFELGGKGANIIFDDVDVVQAADIAAKSGFFNQGEFCLAGPRVFVQRPIYEQFLEAFTKRVQSIKVGDPMAPDTDMGALIMEEHLERVLGFVANAEKDGGRIVTGGRRLELPAPFDKGNFMEPTIIADVAHEDAICQLEVFGPVVTVVPFDEEEEAVGWANDTRYGLSSVVQTNNLSRAHRVAGALEVGTVWVNDFFVRDLRVPFGGMKQSGIGREGGQYSLELFTEAKTICVRVD